MIKKIKYIILFLLPVFSISCNNDNKAAKTKNTELSNKGTFLEKKNDIKTIIIDSIIKNLQGEWREPEYPFRRVNFRNATVKFTEEGVVEEPTFKEFKVLNNCPFEVNNINTGSKAIFLVIEEAKTCEILNVFSDTLTLSGFNAHTKSNYKIIYSKVE